ncbi:MAG: hypothetical protein ACEQSB_04455 [Undibacterium sp.]
MQTSIHFSLKALTSRARAPLISQLGNGFAFVEGHLEIPTAGDWDSSEFARQSQMILRERQEPRLARQQNGHHFSACGAAPSEEMSGFYTGQLLPGKLVFSRAGEPMTVGVMTIESILEIAAHYIGLGYVGILCLFARSNYGPRAGVSPHLIPLPGLGIGPFVTIVIGNPDTAPDHRYIRIDYDRNDSSQTPIANRLISICTHANLPPFEPEPVRQAA